MKVKLILLILMLLASISLAKKSSKIKGGKNKKKKGMKKLKKLLSSIQSDFSDSNLEKPDSNGEIKNKNYEEWIRRISRAKTYSEYQKYSRGFKNLVKRFKRKFKKCVPPPAPHFNQIYKSKVARECFKGYEKGFSEAKNFVKKVKKNKGKFNQVGNRLKDLLKTMPVDYNNVFQVCRDRGAKEGFKKWRELVSSKKKMKEFLKEQRLKKKMKDERMKYYQRLEEILPIL